MRVRQLFLLVLCSFSFSVIIAQTASNGLTKVGNDFRLGGTLAQATAIDMGTTFTFKFSKGTSSYFFVDNNGNIGIGTISPSSQLHTTGSIRFQGLSNNNTLTKIVVTDANGNLSLRDASTLVDGTNYWTQAGFDIYNNTSGNVGIGISTPQFKLDVNGESRIKGTASAAGNALEIWNLGAPAFNFKNNGSLEMPLAGLGIGMATINNTYPNPIISKTNSSQYLSLNNALFFAPNSDNILIGTATDAGYKLDVAGNLRIRKTGTNNVAHFSTDGAGGSGSIVSISSDPVGGWKRKAGVDYQASGGGRWFVGLNEIIESSNQDFIFENYQTGMVPVTFKSNGNVLVGTTTDVGYKLAVNGDAIFTKVKVKQYSTWPDYVFRNDHKLPSLSELEKYIQQNNHLPDVPSAKEVEENGLDLGDHQAILLKKIEELTLYIIDINKKLEKLSEENSELKKKLALKSN